MNREPRLALGEDLVVTSGTDLLARYTRPPAPAYESPRPFWHPVRSRGGVLVSDHRPPDHSWHWGLSVAVSNITVEALHAQVNLWGGVTWVTGEGYRQLANNGRQRHDGWAAATDRYATERLTWLTAGDEPFLAEERTVRAGSDGDDAWRLDVSSAWTNLTDGRVRFGSPTTAGRPNAGYGGFFLRCSDRFLGAAVELDDQALTAEDAQGRPGTSLRLTSTTAPVAVAMSAAASNPVSPTSWFVRTDPVAMLCAAPFFHREWTLTPGARARWDWRLQVTDRPPYS